MRRIAHISDLHFGTEDAGIRDGLLLDLQRSEPSLIAISGDFTQRARRSQYQSAAEFLRSLPARWVAVPGNHDVPLFDLIRRFLWPLARYRAFVSEQLNPFHEDDELLLLGLNTARSLTWKSGRISLDQIALLRSRMIEKRPGLFKVVMTHHPFIPPPGDPVSGIDLVGRAALAVPVLDECCVDLLLSGHLHLGYSGNIATHYPKTARTIISAQAGTAISRRRRSEPNAYNLITMDNNVVEIEIRLWRDDSFCAGQRVRYDLHNGEWRLAEDRTVAVK